MSAYATPNDVLTRYNPGRVGQLVNDAGGTTTTAQLQTDPNLAQALTDAAGEIELAVFKGKRYSQTDLNTLYTAYQAGPTNALYNSGSMLVRLNVDLAYGYLVGRKGYDNATQAAMTPRSAWAMSFLDLIKDGERVFNLQPQLAADLPTGALLSSQRTLISQAFDRYFGDLTTDTAFGSNSKVN